ncbi:MAG: tetraacyldisaccharide 4'-kinase [Verrucomicrobia bacterium]|nr:tetraacyldisaccharide 4'-kinase [Verrucomicrobiota bacterium]
MNIETHVIDIIEGRKAAPVTKALLKALSHCYRGAVAARNFIYDWVLPSVQLRIPVISVGNIVAGGTGKTPFIQYLAAALGEEQIAILSRGYRRKSKQTLIVKPTTSPEECGDEPFLLFQKLPKAKVIVGKNRSQSGLIAQALGAKWILLDDGMQHRKLYRDIEIAVMDARDPFGKNHYLPRGLLRDSPKRLAKADLIILKGVKDEDHFESVTARIRQYSDAPITVMNLIVENSVEIASKKVGVFCGIAAPERFIDTLKTMGCDIILKETKPDHLPFTQEELERLAILAHDQGAECLVCTEKDAVKLPEDLKLNIPLIVAKIALKPTFGKQHLEHLIHEVLHE